MEELYTTYGASNKNDSNDFTGCLGLGSKSPLLTLRVLAQLLIYQWQSVSLHSGYGREWCS